MDWGILAVGLAAPLFTVAGTVIGARWARKTGSESNETNAHTASTVDWSTYAQELRQWTEDRLAERDRRLDDLAKDIGGLRSELETLMVKYRIAIAYIRRIVRQLQRHVGPDEIESPPYEITPDL